MSAQGLLFVFLGGGIGSVLRYVLSSLLGPISLKFPFSTLIVNILSCILLGYLIGISSKNIMSPEMKLFLMVGICGGFSTFSTFTAESYQLFNTNTPILAILYMAASFLICLLAIFSGIKLAS